MKSESHDPHQEETASPDKPLTAPVICQIYEASGDPAIFPPGGFARWPYGAKVEVRLVGEGKEPEWHPCDCSLPLRPGVGELCLVRVDGSVRLAEYAADGVWAFRPPGPRGAIWFSQAEAWSALKDSLVVRGLVAE